jgi:hypothetical protein
MIDELDALIRFGDEPTAPTPAARAGARRALDDAIVAERTGRHPRGRRLNVLRLAAIAAATAAVAALVVVGPLAHDGSGGRAALPARLRSAVLAAYDAESANILHVHQTIIAPDGTDYVSDQWSALSASGQQVHTRLRFSDAAGTPLQDIEFTSGVPGRGSRTAAVGDVLGVDYRGHSWYKQAGGPVPPPPVQVPDVIAVGALPNRLAHGSWSDLGTTTLDGRAAIQLAEHNPPAGKLLTVWVDTATHLPIQETLSYTATEHGQTVDRTVTSTLEYLPPTASNRAQLNVTIPAGFTQTTPAH